MFFQAGKWEKAVEIFEAFEKQGMKPNLVVYNSFINALGTGEQWEQVTGEHPVQCMSINSSLQVGHKVLPKVDSCQKKFVLFHRPSLKFQK